MPKPANKSRGEVAVPEIGDGLFLRFTMDSLERLETLLGANYSDIVLERVANAQPSMFKLCLEVALEPEIEDPDKRSEQVTGAYRKIRNVDAFKMKVYDAFFLMAYGMTFEERKAEETKRVEAEMAELEKNPRMAAALLSRLAGGSDTAPDFAQPSSVASPPSKSPTTLEPSTSTPGTASSAAPG